MSRDSALHPDAHGFLNFSGALQAGDDLKIEKSMTVAAAETWCAAETGCGGFTFNSSNVNETLKKVYFKTGVGSGFTLKYDRAWASYVKAIHAPPGSDTQQVWVKRLGPVGANGAPMAVLCVNAGPANATADFTVSLEELGISGGASVRDVWKLGDAPPIAGGGSLVVTGVAGHSSRFFKLTPH
jgi:hypothetical protein